MPDLGVPELLIIAVIVLLLFGPGKAADIGSSLGKSIREFRKATREDEDDVRTPAARTAFAADMHAPDADVAISAPATGRHCVECGIRLREAQKFCTGCGTRVAEPAAAH